MSIKIGHSTLSGDDDLRARARELATKAEALAAEIAVLHQDIRTADEAVCRAGSS
jgi:outer membrane murein-binding lipoprotein Lpp